MAHKRRSSPHHLKARSENTSRRESLKRRAEHERRVGISSNDAAARWLRENDPSLRSS